MLLITGASGTVGREVTGLLAARGVEFRAMSRTPVDGQVYGDFEDRASLEEVVRGVAAVFLLTSGTEAIRRHDLALLDVARRAGVRKVVKLGAIRIGVVPEWHGAGEEAAERDFAATLLRPSVFASNSLHWAGLIREGSPIPNPMGDGKFGVIDPRDIAEVAVEALLGEHTGAFTLTGPELLSVRDQARVLAEVLGREVSTVDIGLEGLPPAYADGARRTLDGEAAVLTDDVERVLGRAPRGYAEWARDRFPR
ncbi:NAD(P)H-binding protein [Actinosynnema sp. NPDC020468]|uniref:NAD(P)H-binding protein n=1 Tax=Actinosynnema sp. NPDC020468 TaxID=3154488 RepID=UPI0033F3368D